MSSMNLEDPFSRREFIRIMGASVALAGISCCTKMPVEKIIPYILAPEQLIPGKPNYYATAGALGGYSRGLLVRSHEGRPTKIEGNPRHPVTAGRSDPFMQAELLQLYDPDRAKSVRHLGEVSTWDAFQAEILKQSAKWRASGGEGVRLLTGHITSPTLLGDLRSFLAKYPEARWHQHEPVDEDQLIAASRLVFGLDLRPLYDFTQAEVVLSLDHDFLGPGPGQDFYSRQFMSRRKSLDQGFNRLYAIEPSISITGACAEHRLPARPSEIPAIAEAIAAGLGVAGFKKQSFAVERENWLRALNADLELTAGRCLVLAGERQPPAVQAIAFLINQKLGNFGKSIRFLPAREAESPGSPGTLRGLVSDLEQDRVSTLLIIGGNPVYDAPGALRFKDQFLRAPLRIRLGLHDDETAYECHWALPEKHFLEAWGDGRAIDGTVTLQQPLISPLYEGRSAIELMSILNGQPGRTDHQAVREYWSAHLGSFDQALADGFIRDSQSKPITPGVRAEAAPRGFAIESPEPGTLEAVIKPDPMIWDGRYSNNAWLQELPKPILQLTWDNCVLLSPATAESLGLVDEDQVEIEIEKRVQRASILTVPGHPNGTATLYLGYGRTRAGHVGNGHGYDAYSLQGANSRWIMNGLRIRKLGTRFPLARTHTHHSMEGRDIVVHSDLATYRSKPGSIVKEELKRKQPSLLPPRQGAVAPREGAVEAWAMVIDLTTCIGCKTCTIACQAENNIPVVGKTEVRRSREMHWIRVDRYFAGGSINPKVFFQPVPCMHCEKAPCEEVCPTVATNHSADGLNQMVYNRCVGTRYCSNNCPYKVRRFNFFQYADIKTASYRLMRNPEVTVRSRGVMEKCTYCIQRIQGVRIEAEKEDRPIRDGELLTACQQACPTDAIVFGDQNDTVSRVSRLKKMPQSYWLLNDLGTAARTSYLASIRNPNPAVPEDPTGGTR